MPGGRCASAGAWTLRVLDRTNPVLDGDGETLQRTQQQQAAADDQRRPQYDVQPQWRGEQVFDQPGNPDHDKRQDENAEHRRPIAGIMTAEGETADAAAFSYLEEAIEETAAAAPRASPAKPEAEAPRGRTMIGFRSDSH
jgi:hypothetical protein